MKNFVVYKSGAGSGKTFTLVKEYLRLALHDEKKLHQNYRRILAVTFTNKAAAEMKGRVIEALDQLAGGDKLSKTGEFLCDELRIEDTELRNRAGIVLTHLLHHYSDFAIGTIDSFTHKIVRTFAQELDLPVNFNVELDAASFYEKVISQLLASVGEDEQVSRLLKEYVLSKAEDNAFWDPEQGMQEFAALLMKEDAAGYLQQLANFDAPALEGFHRQFLDFIRYYRDTLKTGGQRALDLISSAQLSDDDFHNKRSGPQSFFRKCAAGEAGPEEAGGSRLLAAIAEDKWHGSGPSSATVRALAPKLNVLAGELIAFIESNHQYYSLCLLLSKQMYALMLLRKIEEITLQQKQEERIVFISEFNNKIYNLINEEPTPFIYERLGERYQHFLLDEFQDTSSLQWQNLLPLLDNSLAGGWYNLVVGDGKQSIYRWRNANVRQFAALPSLLDDVAGSFNAGRGQALARNFDERFLNTNYRSSGTIVTFNNEIFEKLRSLVVSEGLSGIYAEHRQQVHNNDEGYVTVDYGPAGPEEVDEINFALTKKYIDVALEDGFSYGDICILCRGNTNSNNIASWLVQQQVPVVSSESLLLSNNLEVNTIISYLRTLVNPGDQVSAAAVVTYLHHAGRVDSSALDSLLKRISAGETLSKVLASQSISINPGDRLYNLSDHCLGIIKALDLNKKAHQYMRFFLDEVNEFLVVKNPNISSFLDWWESRRKKASLIIPAGTNAVRIMTIHSSKGLEFPVVIIPYCNWSVFRAEQSWVQVHSDKVNLPVGVVKLTKNAEDSGFGREYEKEQQEQVLDNLNLLYVGLTRAISRMHLLCHRSTGQKAKTVSEWIINNLPGQDPGATAGFFEAGSRNGKQNKSGKRQATVFGLDPIQFNSNEDVVRIKSSLSPAGDKRLDALAHGVAVHGLLARINTREDVNEVVRLGALEGLYPAGIAEELRHRLRALIEREELRPYFTKGISVMTERELVTAGGEVLRPDKVVLSGDHVVIIDYKTGAENPARHGEQMNRYAAALQDMGHKKVKKVLVYLDTDRVVEVN